MKHLTDVKRRRVAVIGAGPVGLEAALRGASLGYDVRVFERGRVGEAVQRWGFVRLFSPLGMNISELGREVTSGELPADDTILSGAEYVDRYLQPLAGSRALHGRVAENHRILRVGRVGLTKCSLGNRADHPFRLLVDGPEGETYHEADWVLDCSGTYGMPNWMGDGNVPALGERTVTRKIDYVLRDVAGAERDAFVGRTLMVVGSGFSAATVLTALAGDPHPGTRVHWVIRGEGPPYRRNPDDPLPERDRLAAAANALAEGADPRIIPYHATSILSVRDPVGRLDVTLDSPSGPVSLGVDRILALVGYRPDTSLQRELQVHHCYATEGPMKLAATLPAGGGDCLAQPSPGPEALRTSEPGFFVLGAKSYGRNPAFLIGTGIRQAEDVFTLIEADRRSRTDPDAT